MPLPEKFHPDMVRLAISSGLVDDQLDDIVNAVQRRRSLIGAERLNALNIGDHLHISSNCRPKLLAGKLCEVTGFEGTDKVKVKLLEPTTSYKWRVGTTITLPKTLIG